jgi:poly(A) polymerase
MIKKFLDKILGKANKPAPNPLGQRVELTAAQHGINPRLLDDNAVRVVRNLKEAGFEAYVVGGAVRDLLVGRVPKDFDVATNATPEEVKGLFRRAFIIGRRFRIVHVVFGRGRDHEVIEVSTFRALVEAQTANAVDGNEKTSRRELADKHHAVGASGRVLRDNVWGPQVEDAARRDFTINALYYDPTDERVVDYHQGVADVRASVLRMIGDPATRYREDPVRILRVARFAAKLGFAIEPSTLKPVAELAPLLKDVPASRLFDEMVKLLQTGHALKSVEQLRKLRVGPGVFPILDAVYAQGLEAPHLKFVELALNDTDRRVGEGKPVAPSFLLACLLWHEVKGRWQTLRDAGEPTVPALAQAIDAVFEARVGDISGRGKLAGDMREIWMMQPRFERRSGNGPPGLVEQMRFRAAFDFLRLRADVGEVPAALAEWWEDYSLGSLEEREALMQAVRETVAPRRAAKAPRPAASAPEAGDDAPPKAGGVEGAEEGGEGAEEAPRRKRRRRRRGGGDGGAPESGGVPLAPNH